ncbi:hypothetical protein AGMMS49942_03670 [Spirochaetia bacterium]|nr:hypothetical protein AGMMS49942_03670 [Spirochaetia bacterium]
MKWDEEFIPGFSFWPEDIVRAEFAAADAAIGTEGEALALRVFYKRMKFHLKTAEEVDVNPDPENRMIEEYERPRLDADIARMEGRMPAACPGCPFTVTCDHKGDLKC